MLSISRGGNRKSGMRPEGRLKCGCRRKSVRLLKLYFCSSLPRGVEVSAIVSCPWASRGEWQAAQPRLWKSFSPWAAATASGCCGAKVGGLSESRKCVSCVAAVARSASVNFPSTSGIVDPGLMACGVRR